MSSQILESQNNVLSRFIFYKELLTVFKINGVLNEVCPIIIICSGNPKSNSELVLRRQDIIYVVARIKC